MTDPRQQLEDIDSIITEAAHYAYDYTPLLCRRYGIGVDDHQDIAQEALARLYRMLLSKPPEDRAILYLKGYMMKIIQNTCLNFIRRSRDPNTCSFESLLVQGYDVQEASISSPECLVEADETRQELRQLILQLPETYRAIAILYFLVDLPTQEIAQLMSLPVNTVKSQVRRCKRKLSEQVLLTRHSGGE